VEWYRKAAEQGAAEAQRNLGWCYSNGFGVAKNYMESYKWLSFASEQGNEQAKQQLSEIDRHDLTSFQLWIEWFFNDDRNKPR
jgi:TPR repeat protein